MLKNFEAVRKKWLHSELELKKYKELLVKSDVAKAALEVKLKHARNQLDVEMKKRHKVESDYQYLVGPQQEEVELSQQCARLWRKRFHLAFLLQLCFFR